jgi:hypothetical protein
LVSPFNEGYEPWLFEYRHDGAVWGIQIPARNATDARARARAISTATLKGPVVFSTPAALGPMTRLICTIRNALKRLEYP